MGEREPCAGRKARASDTSKPYGLGCRGVRGAGGNRVRGREPCAGRAKARASDTSKPYGLGCRGVRGAGGNRVRGREPCVGRKARASDTSKPYGLGCRGVRGAGGNRVRGRGNRVWAGLKPAPQIRRSPTGWGAGACEAQAGTVCGGGNRVWAGLKPAPQIRRSPTGWGLRANKGLTIYKNTIKLQNRLQSRMMDKTLCFPLCLYTFTLFQSSKRPSETVVGN